MGRKIRGQVSPPSPKICINLFESFKIQSQPIEIFDRRGWSQVPGNWAVKNQ